VPANDVAGGPQDGLAVSNEQTVTRASRHEGAYAEVRLACDWIGNRLRGEVTMYRVCSVKSMLARTTLNKVR
jgi:hypothetical protein